MTTQQIRNGKSVGYPQAMSLHQNPQDTPAASPQHSSSGNAPTPTNGLATGSFIAGVVTIAALLTPLGFIFLPIGGTLTIVLGIMALVATKRLNGTGKGMAIAGLALGASSFVLALLLSSAGGIQGLFNF